MGDDIYRKIFWSPSKFYKRLEDHAEKQGLAVLDVGCGSKKFRGATGIDERATALSDISHDLNTFPYPVEDNQYDLIISRQVLEHMDYVPGTLEEFYRIAKPGGLIVLEVPHFSHPEAFRHWQHKHFFTLGSLDYFLKGNKQYKTAFEYVNRHIYIKDPLRAVGLEWLLNRYSRFYERHLAFILQGSSILYVLRAVK